MNSIIYAESGTSKHPNGFGPDASYHLAGWEDSLDELGGWLIQIVAVENSSTNSDNHTVLALVDDDPYLFYREPADEFLGTGAEAYIDCACYEMLEAGWRINAEGRWEVRPDDPVVEVTATAPVAEQASLF